MYEEIFVSRLTKLRLQKGISAREMSLELGQNPGYINNIESGRALPSMSGFFYICDFLNITPHDFFNLENQAPAKLNMLLPLLENLSENQIESIFTLINEFTK